jgi:hypothetical protein
VKEDNDPFVDIADQALSAFAESTVPGAWMVDTFPFRKTLIFRRIPMS